MNPGLARITSVLKMAGIIFFNKANFPVYFVIGIVPQIAIFIIQTILSQNNYGVLLTIGKLIADYTHGPLVNIVLIGVVVAILSVFWAWYDTVLYTIHASLVYSQPKAIQAYLRLGWEKTGHYFITNIIRNVMIFFGVLALVIPGALFLLWYQFTPMIAAIEGKDVDAFKTSKQIVQKYIWVLLWRQTVIGVLYIVPLYVFNAIHPYLGFVWVLTSPFFGLVMTIVYLNAKQAYTASVRNLSVTPAAKL